MKLSVIVACLGLHEQVERSLRAIEVATTGISSEVVLAIAGGSRREVSEIRHGCPSLLTVALPEGALVPQLWAAGLRAASGDLVAFTSAQCAVRPEWARALIAAGRGGADAIGGPLELETGAGPLTAAVFFLRYSAFTREQLGAGDVAGEIAGDNAAYARRALARHDASFDSGFWEVEFHALLRRDGGRLTVAPDAAAVFHGETPYGSMLCQRFAHGRHFGAGRVAAGARSAFVTALLGPLVPFVLTARIAARVLPVRRYRARFAASLPALLGLAGAWAAGEVWGAIAGSGVTVLTPQAEHQGPTDGV